MRDGIQYFRSPSQVIEQSPLPTELFRIGGLVKDESWIKGKKHQFVVTDTENDISAVSYTHLTLPTIYSV